MSDTLYDTSAELLVLNLIDDASGIVACKRGRFYDGYMHDLMSIDKVDDQNIRVFLARNGIMKMLPEALFYNEELLRGISDTQIRQERTEQLKKLKILNNSFFEAFDTIFFQYELSLQDHINQIEISKEEMLLNLIYGVDFQKERNPYIRKLALMLLDADSIKGNLLLLPFCVRSILNAPIACKVRRVVSRHNNAAFHLMVSFIVYIDHLTNREYQQKMASLERFFHLVEYWFMPFDCQLDYCIKDIHQLFRLGDELTLDYNTQL